MTCKNRGENLEKDRQGTERRDRHTDQCIEIA